MLSAPRYDEAGFGLVELLVAMAISSVVLGSFVFVFQGAFVRVSDVDAQSISSGQITDALDRVGDDLRSARSAARGQIKVVSTRDDLRTRFEEEPVTYGDIAFADGRRLAVWTDAQPDAAGPHCATYEFEQVMDPELVWAFVRRDSPPGGACPAGAGAPTEVLALLGTGTPARDAFRFGVLTPTGTGTCSISRLGGGGPLNANERLRIVSVDLDLSSIGSRRGSERISGGRSTFDLWSRLNDDYYYALGCAL